MIAPKSRKEGMVTQTMKMEKKMKASANIKERDDSSTL